MDMYVFQNEATGEESLYMTQADEWVSEGYPVGLYNARTGELVMIW